MKQAYSDSCDGDQRPKVDGLPCVVCRFGGAVQSLCGTGMHLHRQKQLSHRHALPRPGLGSYVIIASEMFLPVPLLMTSCTGLMQAWAANLAC